MTTNSKSKYEIVLKPSLTYQLWQDEFKIIISLLKDLPFKEYKFYLLKDEGHIIPLLPLEIALYNHAIYLTCENHCTESSLKNNLIGEVIKNSIRDSVLYESIQHSKDPFYTKQLSKVSLLVNKWLEVLGHPNPFYITPYINKCIWCFENIDDKYLGNYYLCSSCESKNNFSNCMNRNLGKLVEARRALINVFKGVSKEELINSFKIAEVKTRDVGISFAKKINKIPLDFKFTQVSQRNKRTCAPLERELKKRIEGSEERDLKKILKELTVKRDLGGVAVLKLIDDTARINQEIKQKRT